MGLSAILFAQPVDPTESVPFATPPQVFITVRKPDVGHDVVTVVVNETGYSAALLKLQCGLVGQFAGGQSSEVLINQTPQEPGVLRAVFSCPGIIDRERSATNFDALVKGFLGSASPMVSSFLIQLDGESVGKNTLRRYVSDMVLMEGNAVNDPKGIEYRVEVLTQDTRQLKIPSSLTDLPKSQREAESAGKSLHPAIAPTLILGFILAGALVYFALLKPGSSPKNKRT
jgi:hypothetical protein